MVPLSLDLQAKMMNSLLKDDHNLFGSRSRVIKLYQN